MKHDDHGDGVGEVDIYLHYLLYVLEAINYYYYDGPDFSTGWAGRWLRT